MGNIVLGDELKKEDSLKSKEEEHSSEVETCDQETCELERNNEIDEMGDPQTDEKDCIVCHHEACTCSCHNIAKQS